MGTTLKITTISTEPMKIHLAIPPEKPIIKGYITAHAKLRSKAEMKQFGEDIQDNVYDDDIAVLKEMYTGIDGLGTDTDNISGDAVWDFLLNDKVGSYIVPALIQAYFDQYNDARQKNSARSRSR